MIGTEIPNTECKYVCKKTIAWHFCDSDVIEAYFSGNVANLKIALNGSAIDPSWLTSFPWNWSYWCGLLFAAAKERNLLEKISHNLSKQIKQMRVPQRNALETIQKMIRSFGFILWYQFKKFEQNIYVGFYILPP